MPNPFDHTLHTMREARRLRTTARRFSLSLGLGLQQGVLGVWGEVEMDVVPVHDPLNRL